MRVLSKGLDTNFKVSVMEWVDHPELSEARYVADMLSIVPPLDSLGMGCIEATASGLPVIGTKWQQIPEGAEDGVAGDLAEPTSDSESAGAFDRPAASRDLRTQVGPRGQHVLRGFGLPRRGLRTFVPVVSALTECHG